MAGVVNTPDVTMEAAEAIEQACLRKARELGLLMNVAVVDVGGNLKAFARMDGAWLGSIDVAIKKARTARYFDMQSGDLGPMAQPGQQIGRASCRERVQNLEAPGRDTKVKASV